MQQAAQVSATVTKQPWDTAVSLFRTLKEAAFTYDTLFFASIVLALVLAVLIARKRHGGK